MIDPYQIPPGLNPEQERAFKALAKSNFHFAKQIRGIRGVVKAGKSDRPGTSSRTGEDAPPSGRTKKPVKAISEFCRQCVGGGGRKAAAKLVRECVVVKCDLYPFREGKNPFHKLNLTDEERKRRSDLLRSRVITKSASLKSE